MYLEFRGIFVLSDVGDVSLESSMTGTFDEKADELETQGALGGIIGFSWENVLDLPLRTGLEVLHRYRHDFDTRLIPASGNAVDYNNDLSSTNVVFNVLYDIDTGTTWRPYVGGGIGYARNHSDTDQLFTATGASETIDNDNHNLAYSLQTGVRVRLAEHWAANAGNRCIDLGKAESGRFSNGDQVTADHFAAHDFILGIVYML